MKELCSWLKGRKYDFEAYLEKAMKPSVYEASSEEEAMIARLSLLQDNFEDGLIAPPYPVVIKIKD